MSTFKELLGTDNKKEQIKKIEELLQIVATPEVSLQIRYNGIDDYVIVNLSGGDASFDAIHRMLELTSIAMRREELSAAKQEIQATSDDKAPDPDE